ncbi:Fatty acid hydroxylase superfamily protein [Enhygromyxa salina]|uniref:Fatty acid hydroxylase superfamily protein n=1 Tax=Enhygromyxa salina TaxID=215803 RepID=A0A2S9YAH6_9BACT|nr:sterol desaturase family protein [Enhygromyxa salina]PRQ02021.1 Fatty acid hydroxylase superfamily protein [Enhygromyxa salina]
MIGAKPNYARERGLTLARAFAIWLRELQPKVLIAHLLGWLGYRAYLLGQGDWGAQDLIPLVLLLALHPFGEWIIHVFILHHRPRKVLGLRWDYHAARMHRLHHRDPWDLRFVLMPLPIMVLGSLAGAALFWLLAPTPGVWATAMLVTAAIMLYYEWIHFLTHTSYRPRGRLYRRQWRLHRLHHFKNETYWMGVTRHLGDVVLGTFPEPAEVDPSKTARTLGFDDQS